MLLAQWPHSVKILLQRVMFCFFVYVYAHGDKMISKGSHKSWIANHTLTLLLTNADPLCMHPDRLVPMDSGFVLDIWPTHSTRDDLREHLLCYHHQHVLHDQLLNQKR